MPTTEPRNFDLNIEKILEGWEVKHAIREVIANALDEQVLSNTRDITISGDRSGNWHIRDFGRGIRYENLTQNENPEKLKNASKVIGKFGVGLKDALATLSRRNIHVQIKSAHCDISLVQAAKYGFEDVITLQAAVSPASSPQMAGSDFELQGVSSLDIKAAKDFFLRFSGERVLDDTPHGQILERAAGRDAEST
jgi:Histidine kinase-, DNA gyrase B-, and HSP90-like ATPase